MPFLSPNLQCQGTDAALHCTLLHRLPLNSLWLRFNGHFSRWTRLASTRISLFWISLKLRVMKVVVTTGAIRYAKLWSKCYHQQISTQILQAWCPSWRPTNSVKALKGNLPWNYLDVVTNYVVIVPCDTVCSVSNCTVQTVSKQLIV